MNINQYPKGIVWDFDDTILRIHAYHYGVEVEEGTGRLICPVMDSVDEPTRLKWEERCAEKDCADPVFFRRTVRFALDNNINIAVASFGKKEVIVEYLRQLFGGEEKNPFERKCGDIITPSDFGYEDGCSFPLGKRKMILRIMAKRNIDRPEDILFFDDDLRNVREASRIGVRAYRVPTKETGWVVEECDDLSFPKYVRGFHRCFWAKHPELVELF